MENSSKEINKIVNIFNTMDVNKTKHSCKEANVWMDQFFHSLKNDNEESLDNVLTIHSSMESEKLGNIFVPTVMPKHPESSKENGRCISHSMINFANLLDKNINTLSQLEVRIRGIPFKDTEKYGNLLIDCIRYYSGLTNIVSKNEVKLAFIVGLFSDGTSLLSLGYFLGVALAANRGVVIYAEPKIYIIISYIIELAIKANFPLKQFSIIPDSDVRSGFGYYYERNTMVFNFANIYDKAFLDVSYNPCTTTLISMPHVGNAPMIVFNSADLDSAAECAINACWEHHGSLPWSVRTVYIQEDVFDGFKEKLLKRMKSLSFSYAAFKNVDIAFPDLTRGSTDSIKLAKSKGIDVELVQNEMKYNLVLFIGGRVNDTNVLTDTASDQLEPSLTLLPFRHCNEAVALANNSRYGFAASVWTKNIALANECSKKLNVGIVWINCHGEFKADVSVSPKKKSGIGYFGGIEGISQLKMLFNERNPPLWKRNATKWDSELSNAKKSQVVWSKKTMSSRIATLQEVAFKLESKKEEICGLNCHVKEFEELIDKLTTCAQFLSNNQAASHEKYMITTLREPIGVIGYKMNENANLSVIITALLYGNAIVVKKVEKTPSLKLLIELSKLLPGILQIVHVEVMFNENGAKLDNRLDVLLLSHDYTILFAAQDGSRVLPLNPKLDDCVTCVTHTKAIWSDVIESFL